MENTRVLVALDASENSRRAISYCATALHGLITQCNGEVCVKLFFVEQLPVSGTFDASEIWKQHCMQSRKEQQEALQNFKNFLVEQGIPQACVAAEYVCREDFNVLEDADHRSDVAKRIVNEQREGNYGTLVMGKRGVSKAQAYLFGSVTQHVLESVRDCVVWLVC